MKISSDVESPHYVRRPVRVMVDGEDIQDVIDADDEVGVVVVLDRKEVARLLDEGVDVDEYPVRELYGRVDIILL